MKKMYLDYEIATPNGDIETGTVRILAADKVRFEAVARSQGWPIEDGPRAVTLMLHSALIRTGVTDVRDFEEFATSVLLDYATRTDDDTADDTADPTR